MYTHYLSCLQLKNFCHLPEIYTDTQKPFFLAAKTCKHLSLLFGEGNGNPLQYSWASLVAQLVKNPPAMGETQVWSLDWEDLLEKGTPTHSSILASRIPWTEEPSRLQSMELHATLCTVARQAILSMGFFQARILEWVAISFSKGSSWPRDQTCISCIAGRFFAAEPDRAYLTYFISLYFNISETKHVK